MQKTIRQPADKIKNYKKILLHCFIASLLVGFFILPFNTERVLAEDTTIMGTKDVKCSGVDCSTDTTNKYCCGNYQLDDFVKIAIKIADFIFGITGSLALLMFVYGGFMFLISSGSTETVNKAKQIIIGAVAGIVIIFTSYMIVGFVFTATGADTTGASWSKINWFSKK